MTPAVSLARGPAAAPALPAAPALAGFWDMDGAAREDLLLRGIAAAHAYHFEHDTAYRNTVAGHGVGPRAPAAELPRLLRTTSQAFKSYIDILGTRFPEDCAMDFFHWLTEQVSVDLRAGARHARPQYRSLEGLLRAVERAFAGVGLEMLTSSGFAGRMALIPRDLGSNESAAESLSLSLQHYLGVTADFTVVFMTPKRTRVAVPRLVRSAVRRVGVPPDRVHFAVPLPAGPDRMRARAGRVRGPDRQGAIGKRVSSVWTNLESRFVDAQAVDAAVSRLIPAGAHDEKVLVFGSLAQLHNIASFLLEAGRTLTLAPGSVLCSWGGLKERTTRTPAQMRLDLRDALKLTTGEPAPLRDLYGMAEANWAAMQCSHGNYHVPPWIHVVTLDDDEALQKGLRSTGRLAFFDPYGGGELFPAFFHTPDRVTLVRGPACPCGEVGSYLEEPSVRRLGQPDETPSTPRP